MVASKNKSAIEKRWHEAVCLYVESSDFMQRYFDISEPEQYHLDHFLGSQAKRKVNFKSEKVGEFAVNPVPIELHDIHSNHPHNVTNCKNKFIDVYGSPQSIFYEMVLNMRLDGYVVPFDDAMLVAIIKG